MVKKWKLFFFLPRLFLFRASWGGLIPRSIDKQERVAQQTKLATAVGGKSQLLSSVEVHVVRPFGHFP